MGTEIYADVADLETMSRLAADKRIKGFTTNPSLMKKAGIGSYRNFASIVMGMADGHVEMVRLENLWQYYWHLNWLPPATRPQ